MAQQTFKVVLQRKVADIEQQAIVLVTTSSKKKAGEIAVGRADDEAGVEWTPILAEGLVPNDDTDIDILSVEPTDELPPSAKPPNERDSRQGDKLEGGSEAGPDGGTAPAGAGTTLAHVPDLPEGARGTHGTRVTGNGVIEQPSPEQIRREHAARDEETRPRATSAPELAAPPGCGGVKAAMGNPIERVGGDGGRLLDVNSAPVDRPADKGAERVGARDLAQEQPVE